MRLSPREQESLLVHHAGSLAQKRLARGVRLNYPEAVALIACQLQEFVRDGRHAIAELMSLGSTLLGTAQVMPGVANMIHEVQVEATFPDGTKLITAHDPIKLLHGNLELALYGSFLPVPDVKVFEREILLDEATGFRHKNSVTSPEQQRPGEIIPVDDPNGIELNAGRRIATLSVTSTCDRAIQVSSHFHFIEVNPRLLFDRRKALGMRLNIPAGTAVRFEPGDRKTVQLVEISGKRIVRGGNMLCNGEANDDRWNEILQRIQAGGFLHQEESADGNQQIPAVVAKIPRRLYAAHYGPTVGDRIRLGDTSLIVQVERDYAVYGDECTFGGGKTLREAMGQATGITNADGAPDTVIVNALIIDAQLGIVKADIGVRNGMICGIGKAGNPDCMDGVDPTLIFGPGTEAISGDGLILTAGAIDSHIHFICPQICREAIASGITTLIGGGTGPATGTCATTCTPGPNNIRMMLQATDNMPINFGFTGKGNTSQITNGDQKELAAPLVEQIRAGACGLKLHEDWGTTPAAIDTGLAVGQAHDVQITIHTDTLNESACVEESIKAFAGRTIHAYHSEGAGGGHAPDIIRVCGEPNVIPSSTNPTRPLTHNTMDEHMDMLMVCHHLNRNLKEDLAFAESRIRAETMAAEDILHDLGAISIISSDSQAMGRVGEVICRTWQTADKMKLVRGILRPEDEGFGVDKLDKDDEDSKSGNDNFRAKRYIAKYTINPAIVSGMSHLIGSIAVGKLADMVLWRPDHFGAKPEMVIKGGTIAWSQMGMPNASIPPVEPVKQRKMFGSYGGAAAASSVAFVSQACVDDGVWKEYGTRKRVEAVKGCRGVGKKDMVLNAYLPNIKVNPETFRVSISRRRNGDDSGGTTDEEVVLQCGLSMRLPLAQRYFLF